MLARSLAALPFALLLAAPALAQSDPPAERPAEAPSDGAQSVHAFEVKTLRGEAVKLEKYRGKVLLIVNTASRCGLTPQYEGLQALYEEHRERGLVVLGFPCNQFGGQEPGTAEEIETFCREQFAVSFPMFAKVEVNGEGAAPLWRWLTARKGGAIRWNFTKFLIGRDGELVERFEPKTAPDAEALRAALERALAAPAPAEPASEEARPEAEDDAEDEAEEADPAGETPR